MIWQSATRRRARRMPAFGIGCRTGRRSLDYAGSPPSNNRRQGTPQDQCDMRLNELLLARFGGWRERAAKPLHAPAVLARAERRRRSRRWGLLASADFRRLWTIGIVAFALRWLEMLVVGVFVYQHTGSAFDVALMTMLRMLPMAPSSARSPNGSSGAPR